MASDDFILERRRLARFAGGGAAFLLAPALVACGGNEDDRKVKGLKMQVQDRYGAKDYRKGLELAQKGLALSRKSAGDKDPDTLYFAQAITENQLALHNFSAGARALKQEISLRADAGQAEKKLQSRRTLLIQLSEQNGDKSTSIEQTVIIAQAIDMGLGKDPQPTYRPMPDYPPEQFRNQVEGDVDIAFNLDADGTPTAVRVKSSTPPAVFDSAALEAFRKWRFTPYIANGEPVSSTGHHFTLAFRLSKGH
jgi:TonB family protein